MMDNAARAARRKVEKRAAQLGATLKVGREGRYLTVRVEAPKGHHWPEGIHEFVADLLPGPWSYDEVFEDVLSRMQDAPVPCDADSCGEAGCEWWEGR